MTAKTAIDAATDPRRDELLAIRCQLGEPAAFEDLIARWHAPLWTYVRRVLGEQEAARDTLQDVWIRVIRGIPRLREPASLRPWLFGIARRAMMDRMRGRYADPVAGEIDVDTLPDTAVQALDEHDLAALDGALANLPVLERDVLTLFYLEELSLTEVAAAMNVPVGTVKSRLFRARRLLRQAMDARGER